MVLDGPTCIIRKTYLKMIVNLTSPEYFLSKMGTIHSRRRRLKPTIITAIIIEEIFFFPLEWNKTNDCDII
jgi:hypothetical protein